MKSLLIKTFGLVLATLVKAHTYESLNVDATQKLEAEAKIAADSVLPVINITTRNNTELILSRDIYTDCVVDIFNVDGDYQMKEKSAAVKVRGNSSSYFGEVEKIKENPVPYRIKFDKKTNMLGLHSGEKFKNWVLLRCDWDIIRNDIALRMSRAVFEDTAYVSDSKIVKLYVNDQFQGDYVLAEQQQINEKRINVNVPEVGYNGTDIGYLVEIDHYYMDENYWFEMDYEKAVVTDIIGDTKQFVEASYTIKNKIYSQEQVDFIASYTRNVFKIIYLAVEKGEYKTFDEEYRLVNSTFTNAQDTIDAVLDIEAAVSMYLLYEIVHDYDVGEGSFNFAVDFSENSVIPKLQMTAPWDFNWAYDGSAERYWAATFCEEEYTENYGERSNPWFIELAKEEWFHELVAEKWVKVSKAVRSQLADEVEFSNVHQSDFIQMFERAMIDIPTLVTWIENRFNWLDKEFIPGVPLVLPFDQSQQPEESISPDLIEDIEDDESIEVSEDNDHEDAEDSYEEQDSDDEQY